jgi:hypothetical protein
MSANQQQEGSGCAAFVVVILVVAAVVAGVISIAALVDPFSWMPPVNEVWKGCEDNLRTAKDECALANRFPGFWGHVIANFAWSVAAVGLAGWLTFTATELRASRSERFSGPAAVERYRIARSRLAMAGSLVAVLAALPIVAAIAR